MHGKKFCRLIYPVAILSTAVLMGIIIPGSLKAESGTNALSRLEIRTPPRGGIVSELRPVVEVSQTEKADGYVIEISPETTFTGPNTISYASTLPPNISGIVRHWPSRLRFNGIVSKYERYKDKLQDWRWKIPYNLTAVVRYPYGYRVIPCRDWLKMFADIVSEDHADPLRSINEFVSFSIVNQGSGTGYYNAFEVLTRDAGVCGHTAELVSALAAAKGYPSKILNILAVDQGHVVAASRRPNGQWVLYDGLYNIEIKGEIDQLVKRVKEDPSFLNFEAFRGSKIKYRDLFTRANTALNTESTYGGIRFSTQNDRNKGFTFKDLRFQCGPDMASIVASQSKRRYSNVFFVRATYHVSGNWAPWAYSYFVFRPKVKSGQVLVDNAKLYWDRGNRVPNQFVSH